FNFDMSSSTHSRHVFLGLPRPLPFTLSTSICLHADTQSSGCLCSTCLNHLSLPRLTTTETHSMSSRLNSSALAFLSLSLTPHIHLIIILSVLLVFAYPLPSLPTSRCHILLRSEHKSDKLFLLASSKPSLP